LHGRAYRDSVTYFSNYFKKLKSEPKKVNQNERFPWRSAFCLCFFFTHCLHVFIGKEHIEIRVPFGGIFLRVYHEDKSSCSNAVSLVVSLRNLTYYKRRSLLVRFLFTHDQIRELLVCSKRLEIERGHLLLRCSVFHSS